MKKCVAAVALSALITGVALGVAAALRRTSNPADHGACRRADSRPARGQGSGLAVAAELNGYPGPSHVIELVTLWPSSRINGPACSSFLTDEGRSDRSRQPAYRSGGRPRPAVCCAERDAGHPCCRNERHRTVASRIARDPSALPSPDNRARRVTKAPLRRTARLSEPAKRHSTPDHHHRNRVLSPAPRALGCSSRSSSRTGCRRKNCRGDNETPAYAKSAVDSWGQRERVVTL